MTGRDDALEALEEALGSLEELSEPGEVEPTLDAIAAALKPLLELPEKLERKAVSLDELLAWLAREGGIGPDSARAASRLLEVASVEGYAWETPAEVSEDDKWALLEALRSFYDDLLASIDDDDDDA